MVTRKFNNVSNGDVANTSSQDDNTKTYHPKVNVAPLTANSIKNLSPLAPLPDFNNNSLTLRYTEYSDAFTISTRGQGNAGRDADMLLNNFVNGNGKPISFTPTSPIAGLLSKDPAFLSLVKSFETQALKFYKENNGSLEGFNGNDVLAQLKMPYIKGTLFMHAVMGGTQQWNAQIRQISANEIKVQYTVWDRYGAGTEDAGRANLPGLPSLYWLQHNAAHYYPSTSSQYNPFTWNIEVNR